MAPDTTSSAKRHVEVPWLAKPSGTCCLQGHLHTGTPRGKFESIAGVDTYITAPNPGRSNGNILFYFADVYGMFINAQLVMDAFADAGYLVLGPDYFRNDPVFLHRLSAKVSEPGFDFDTWKDKHAAEARALLPAWIAAVKAAYGSTKGTTRYACAGYCFGAPFVCEALAAGDCAVGGFAHPAFLNENHFRDLKAPLHLSCAEIDHTFPAEARERALAILVEGGKKYSLQLFQGVEHGFALRADLNDAYQGWAKEQSLRGMVAFFDFWLSQ